ncbi:MAG TPA: NADH-quinone oxidoreductase subunit NuoF [Victivallales bacterium]|nr:NADH-quinone oxidoreductase subunit NuoF [Victivallales bacterium]
MNSKEILKKFAQRKDNLLLILHELQNNNPANYLQEEDLMETADYLNSTYAEIYGVAKYYSMFSLTPRGKYVIRVCRSPICRMKGSKYLLEILKDKLNISVNEVTKDGLFSIETAECLGHCYESPVMMINQAVHGNMDESKIANLINDIKTRHDSISVSNLEKRVVLKNIGRIDPENINDYKTAGGYEALQSALQLKPSDIIEELASSNFIGANLKGRGGAGFSTGLKMKFTSSYAENETDENRNVYLVCNADEGEPGTFKDRVIMENDPHLLIEGMLITAYSIGATKGYLYIRGEYFLSIQRIKKAVSDAYDNGYLGKNIYGSGFSFDIEVRLGAGSYLCGEELTLLESLEGKRGYPRIKPPFPAEKGLFNRPTLVNNVETLANIPAIIKNGPKWYSKLGTEKSTGTKIFNLSGNINNPGYYEVEFGITIRDLINKLGGGVIDGTEFKGALLGGAAGTFVDSTLLDTQMGYDELKEKGAVLGSGAVIVFNNFSDIFDILKSILEFFKHESCGKCAPCRIGCKQLLNILDDIKNIKEDREKNIQILLQETEYMAKNSLCPLGQSPIMPVKSAIRYFKSELLNLN